MNKILQLLVILQDLDEMIGEAENTDLLKEQEELGFEIKGLEKLKEAREELLGKLPPDVFGQYEKIRRRYGRAIAPVRENICLGCFITIPTALSNKNIGNLDLRNCENCGRFLYWV
jgi:predicted  nucleic acid-binding Zn-ribbon protein